MSFLTLESVFFISANVQFIIWKLYVTISIASVLIAITLFLLILL